ncbi:MAG TPA: XdhC family protein [Tepidisphaeraceae bacterium]|jgi:xanthine/CO dehydrogenase XdhC/CoxF family maturation factor|nr:XdhC family protein [Tepidisphaeraceae bacterium]
MRHELPAMIALAERLLNAGEPGTLATLFASRGSTYRPLGSMMVSGPPGLIAGGVSGGCLEEYVARHGRSLTQHQPAEVLSFAADPDGDDGKPILGCGGSIEVLVERLTPIHLDLLRQLQVAHDADAPSLLACTLDVSDGHPTALRQWLTAGTDIDHQAVRTLAARAASDARSSHGPISDNTSVLAHYVPPITRLVICGGGDDARPLADIARSLGWHVSVIDRRARLATADRFTSADQVQAGPWEDVLRAVRLTPRTAVVLMTHSLPDDVAILPLLAARPLAYVGSLGPPHRRQWLIEQASEIAGLPADFIARFRGPIGLNLGDRSAAGIAVAVVADIMATLNDCDARPLSQALPIALPGRHPSLVRNA